MDILKKNELNEKLNNLMDYVKEEINKLEEEYGVENITFQGIHTDEGWITATAFNG